MHPGEGVRNMTDSLNPAGRAPRRATVFGLALVVSLVMGAALASGASALSFTWEPGLTATLTAVSGEARAETPAEMGGYSTICQSASGTAAFTSGTSGTVQLAFSQCKWGPFEASCTSPGASTGKIRTKALSLTPVYLDAAKTKFGLKISPQTVGGPVAEFNCGGFNNVVWTGSVLGQITEPALNVSASTFKLPLSGYAGTQTYEQIEGAGTKYHLNKQSNSGPVEFMSLSTLLSLTLNEGKKGKFIP
jgi:hypothetical protein